MLFQKLYTIVELDDESSVLALPLALPQELIDEIRNLADCKYALILTETPTHSLANLRSRVHLRKFATKFATSSSLAANIVLLELLLSRHPDDINLSAALQACDWVYDALAEFPMEAAKNVSVLRFSDETPRICYNNLIWNDEFFTEGYDELPSSDGLVPANWYDGDWSIHKLRKVREDRAEPYDPLTEPVWTLTSLFWYSPDFTNKLSALNRLTTLVIMEGELITPGTANSAPEVHVTHSTALAAQYANASGSLAAVALVQGIFGDHNQFTHTYHSAEKVFEVYGQEYVFAIKRDLGALVVEQLQEWETCLASSTEPHWWFRESIVPHAALCNPYNGPSDR